MKLTETKTIVLIHGLWMTPHSWEPFRGFFTGRGYDVHVPAWPRLGSSVEAIRANPFILAGLGLREITEHYAQFVQKLEKPPVLIGHSMGGLVVQMLLGCGLGAAGVSIDGAAPKGIYRLPLSMMKAAGPVLSNPLNINRTVMLTFEQFRYAFANTMSRAVAREIYEREVLPGPGRPIFEVAFGNFSPRAANKVDHRNHDRAPLLLIAGSEDHLVPAVLNRINWKLHKQSAAVTDYKEFPARSHLIIAQDGWAEVAAFIDRWFRARVRGLTAAPAVS